MEFNVIEESKTKLVFELKGETHTFCNVLKKELQDTKGVELVTYKIDHPLVGIPKFHIETKGV
ncbi:DNA-directed RNA polymerase subunit L, partial [Candidatus Woesearchaeota archaeon]|nr:DNA-directed RNA polymerase subunit L [Candidatus Woesearchaeota archaeon]